VYIAYSLHHILINKQVPDLRSIDAPPHRGTGNGYHALSRRSPSVGPDLQDPSHLSDVGTAACQSDQDMAVISSLLKHVILERKDLGCGFRQLLVYFIIYFWFLELKGVNLSQSKEPIYEIGGGAHSATLASADILTYLDQFVHPLPGFTAHLQNGTYFSPGRTIVRRLKGYWEEMGTRLERLRNDDKSRWRTLSYVYGPTLPPARTSDDAKDLGPTAYKMVYTMDWHNLIKALSSPGVVLPST
jgi:hypothetical protein